MCFTPTIAQKSRDDCPGFLLWRDPQVRPAPEYLHWQRLHEAVNEARERVSKAYMQMDEIDRDADLSPDGK